MWISGVTQLGRWWTTLSGPLAFLKDLAFSMSITATLTCRALLSLLLATTPLLSNATDSLTLPWDMSVWPTSLKVSGCRVVQKLVLTDEHKEARCTFFFLIRGRQSYDLCLCSLIGFLMFLLGPISLNQSNATNTRRSEAECATLEKNWARYLNLTPLVSHIATSHSTVIFSGPKLTGRQFKFRWECNA